MHTDMKIIPLVGFYYGSGPVLEILSTEKLTGIILLA